jgi:hypothetical protein|tara:strand:- start:2272 stop:2613 length:342 start_codon:yes stop_codon:yes gene_type:complete
MPGAGTMRSKQKRAGSLGQSARLYTLKLGNNIVKIPGAQGFGQHNAAIGSVLSLGIVKQTRKAGGNNVCMFNTHLHGSKFMPSGVACGKGCQGPKAGCPNCFNNKTKCTLTTK